MQLIIQRVERGSPFHNDRDPGGFGETLKHEEPDSRLTASLSMLCGPGEDFNGILRPPG